MVKNKTVEGYLTEIYYIRGKAYGQRSGLSLEAALKIQAKNFKIVGAKLNMSSTIIQSLFIKGYEDGINGQ